MKPTLRQFAETAVEPRDALRAFIADTGPVTEDTAHAFLRGETKRLRKYLSDLAHEGSIARNQSGAWVFVGWKALPRRRYPATAQAPIAFADDLTNARAPAPSTVEARAPDVSNRIESSRIDLSKDHSTRLESRSSGLQSARDYISEKLCLPKLQRFRIEATGGNAHISRKFAAAMREDPEQLSEWIGDAATPAITDPVRFLNTRLTEYERAHTKL